MPNSLWTYEACFTREVVLSVLKDHLWKENNCHPVCECGYYVCYCVDDRVGMSGDIVVAAMLIDSLVARRYLSFLETVLLQVYKDGRADVVS